MNKLSIFVTVGTNHYNFSRMLDLVHDCLFMLDFPYDMTVQYGFSSVPEYFAKYKLSKMLSRQDTEMCYKNSDLVFSHCGIGSIYNSLSLNRPTVIIPRLARFDEFSDDHQLQIAREISKNPLVHMIEEVVSEKEFMLFIKNKVPKPKVEVDLTNHKLAEFIKSRLFDGR